MNWTAFALGALSFLLALATVFAFLGAAKASKLEAQCRLKLHGPQPGDGLKQWLHYLVAMKQVPAIWDTIEYRYPAVPEPDVLLDNGGNQIVASKERTGIWFERVGGTKIEIRNFEPFCPGCYYGTRRHSCGKV